MEFDAFITWLSERGRKAQLAQSAGVSKQTVSDWVRNRSVSSRHAAKVSMLTGFPKSLLCPEFDWGEQ